MAGWWLNVVVRPLCSAECLSKDCFSDDKIQWQNIKSNWTHVCAFIQNNFPFSVAFLSSSDPGAGGALKQLFKRGLKLVAVWWHVHGYLDVVGMLLLHQSMLWHFV